MVKATKHYTIVFEPDKDGWWAVSVREVPGCRTQARSIRQGRGRIREALALFVRDAHTARLVDDVRVAAEVKKVIKAAQAARERADREQEEASALARKAARELTRSMSVRDASEVLHLSHQRVQQLVSS